MLRDSPYIYSIHIRRLTLIATLFGPPGLLMPVGVLADALRRHQLLLDGRLARVSLDKSLIERCSRADFDTDALLEPLRSIDGVEVVALSRERGPPAAQSSRYASSTGRSGRLKCSGRRSGPRAGRVLAFHCS